MAQGGDLVWLGLPNSLIGPTGGLARAPDICPDLSTPKIHRQRGVLKS